MIGLLLVADVTARAYAESRLQTAVDQHGGPDVRARAQISSFPFLGRLLVAQDVSHVDLHVDDLGVNGLTFDRVDLALSGVRVDRQKLVADQRVHVTGIDRGEVSADLSQAALSTALGTDVEIIDGKVQALVLGHRVGADVEVRDNRLSLRVAGVTLPTFAIPGTALLPCLGNARVLDGHIRFSCTVDQVPPAVLNLINGAAANR